MTKYYNKYYEQKKVEVFYTIEGDKIITVKPLKNDSQPVLTEFKYLCIKNTLV